MGDINIQTTSIWIEFYRISNYDEYLKEKLIKPMYLASALATSDSSRQIANPNRTDNTAPTKEKSSPPNAAETKKSDKIEDYGEKIGGARKDKARADMEAVLSENPTDAEILSLPSAKLYPAPNYAKLAEQGMNAESLALLRVVYDFLRPKKPGPSAMRWTSQKDVFIKSVRETRQLISDIIAGKLTLKDLGGRRTSHHCQHRRQRIQQKFGTEGAGRSNRSRESRTNRRFRSE